MGNPGGCPPTGLGAGGMNPGGMFGGNPMPLGGEKGMFGRPAEPGATGGNPDGGPIPGGKAPAPGMGGKPVSL